MQLAIRKLALGVHQAFGLGRHRREERAIEKERVARGLLAAFDVTPSVCVALSVLGHVALAGALAFASARASVDVDAAHRDRVLVMTRYLVAIAEREEGTGASPPEARPETKADVPRDTPPSPRVRALHEAAEFGMIGVLPSASDDSDARGSMWGSTIQDSIGFGGLGLAAAGGRGLGSGRGGGVGHGVGASADAERDATPLVGSGTVKAGEWDDNANYEDFQRYLANEENLPIHRVDVSDRTFLVVRDRAGKAVPGCRVTASDGLHEVTLTTTPSGRAILFAHAEGVDGKTLRATADCSGSSATATFSLADHDRVIDLKLPDARALPAAQTIDVAFVLDTTGSMSEEITAVRSTIAKVASSLRHANVAVRIGLVEYKDRGDPFVTRVHPMSSNVAAFLDELSSVEASGGGDTPESVNEGLHAALTRLAWNRSALGHFAFLIGDAPPHLDYANDFDYAADMREAAHRGVQVFTIAASGMDTLGQAVWRQIAQYTGATNMFVLRGGAGPQSVGAGDPKSSCGGTQTQYASGQLDALILAKINGELAGLERDPLRIPGLNGDESAKPCNERVLAQK